jgi:ABC-type Fe3+ transport system substrate-binding protein
VGRRRVRPGRRALRAGVSGRRGGPAVGVVGQRLAGQGAAGAFDLALVQPDAALTQGRPDGIWAPIKPLLVHPDALADGAWRDGLNARFLDAAGDLCFAWEHQVLHAYAINTDLAQAGEIATVKDLLDRKWAGKVISSDPRLGIGLFSAASVAKTWGVEVVKQLLVDQRPTFSAGGRHLAEALVRGRFPVALGVRPKALAPFRDEGLDRKVAFLDLPDADFAATTALLYFDRAPHPAAAKLFANWILTREGQTVLTSSLPTNSARADVDAFEPTGVGTAGKRYYEPDREANYQHTAATRAFIHGLPGGISLTGAA